MNDVGGAAVTALLGHPASRSVRLITGGAGADRSRVSAVVGIAGSLGGVGAELDARAGRTDGVVASDGAHGGPGAFPAGSMLVLLTPLERMGWQFDALILRAAHRSITAIALARGPECEISVASTHLAERSGIVLLECPDPWRFSVDVSEQLGAVSALTARSALAAAHIGQLAGEGVDEVIGLLSKTAGHPVRLVDSTGVTLVGADPSEEYGAGELAVLADRDKPFSEALASGGTLVAAPVATGFGSRPWLVVALADPVDAELATISVALDVGSVAVGHRLALRRMADERDARHRTTLLGEILDAAGELSAPLAARALDAGWNLGGVHIGIRVVARGDIDLVARRLELEQAFAAEGLEVQAVEQADGWVAWLTAPQQPPPTEIAKISTAIRRAQQRADRMVPTQVGVGRAHQGRDGLARSLAEASDAVRLAAGRPHNGYFVHIDRLDMAQLLLAWTRTDTFLPAAAELLAPLEKAGSELLPTLSAYLDAESSLVTTAAVLGIHRNTVADRIARIQRLLAVDLADPETRLALHLACRTV